MLETLLNEIPRFFTYYNIVFLLKALLATFLLSALGCVIGSVLGFLIAVGRNTTSPVLMPLRGALILYTEMFRRIPFLVTLMLAFFVFQALKWDLSMFSVALVTVCAIGTAFIAEIVRSGFESVHDNQWDAAYAMNFSYLQTLRYVVVPQAWKVILPPVFSFFILFIKDTALASQIGVLELTYAGKVMNNKGFSATLVFGTILILYFSLSYPLAKFGQRLEKKLAPARNR
ncbi:amino acid ABC transporter permease [Parapusillimonas granuli]|uniref:Amino acid ABC transporter permease n=1 Tax=Parapusillimonas granuli TaxID=380911 RepID=A0A853FZT0_9BURK|nr:amino acid ABC transporter permease [Parapusillimonas granuli]MBB5214439.1 polar amino acid transport system permease protein [Parapusillimonas granuli]NYT49152.1 amino acid ABC transporter permease [Parapusillimonas granuli]